MAGEPALLASISRKLRLVGLLSVAEQAGLTPLPIGVLHAFAYFANVLAPVWKAKVLDGRILKKAEGPFYPSLQSDLDRLVGAGLALITDVSHRRYDDGRWSLQGSYSLNRDFAAPILTKLATYEEERGLLSFMTELAFALSALDDAELRHATVEDATWANPAIDRDNVVDFAEWNDLNFTANAAEGFVTLVPGVARATVGELVHLYVQHMKGRMHGNG